jgi:hypothetical protein
MILRLRGAPALILAAGVAIQSTGVSAETMSLEQRLKELESAYTELLIRDREKSQELDRLRGEVSALRQGKRDPVGKAGTPEHEHGHDHGHGRARDDGHDHADADGHASEDVLFESKGVRFYVPSIGIDLVGYKDDTDPPLEERLEGLPGFGHSHDDEDGDGHEHGTLVEGFNLRHAEVGFAAELLGYGRGQILINGSLDGVELEEAFVKTVPILDVASFKAGQFRSNFGYFNAYHSPEWKFADAPLPHYLIFGDHGLDGLGMQGEFAVPGVPLKLGLEGFQGGGETIFMRNDEAGNVDEPSVFVGWLKGRPYESGANRLDLGFAGGIGRHQEVHDEGGTEETFKGDAWFLSPGFTFSRRGAGEHGAGDVVVKGEYIYRVKDLSNTEDGEPLEATQDGYYVQAAYGFAPRFEAGLRWEQVGLFNEMTEGDETEDFGRSWRIGGFFAYKPLPWTRVGVQSNYGSYDFEDGRDEVFQAMARLVFQYGPHFH